MVIGAGHAGIEAACAAAKLGAKTALFVIIFIDQWEKAESHIPAIAGIVIAVVCLLVVGPQYFLLPSLIIASAVLVVWNMRRK